MHFLTNCLQLEDFHISSQSIVIRHSIDGKSFQTEIYYENMDFQALMLKYGTVLVENIAFHIALIEGMKYCSLAPHFYDISRYSSFFKADTETLFTLLYQHIFAQHRWENNLAHYPGPIILADRSTATPAPITMHEANPSLLLSCGGGKDSLVAMKLIERLDMPYAVMQYSHSVYGDHQQQHALIDALVACCNTTRQHRFHLHDPFLEKHGILKEFPGNIRTFCAPETPCGIFEALPVLLQHGYTALCLGHERGADTENFFWEEENRFVNHQWGKSLEAEQAMSHYIQSHLVTNLHVFSILKPIHDFLIFRLLQPDRQYVSATHSCNIAKPWCKRCPKCVYIWLSMLAYVQVDLFNENLFDEPAVQKIFFQLMGKEGHRPFECVGEVGEACLALYSCLKQERRGAILDTFEQDILPQINIMELLTKYNAVHTEEHNLPLFLREPILSIFQATRVNEQEFLVS